MRTERAAAAGYFAPLVVSSYTLLTTYRRTGVPVATPVNVAAGGDRAWFRTWDTSGKAKRLRHTPQVQVRPCTVTGKPRGEPLGAQARLLDGAGAGQAARALAARYPLTHSWLIPRYHRLRGWRTLHYELAPPDAENPAGAAAA